MKIELRLVEIDDVDDEYVSWHQNTDGHLDFFSGSRRSFSEKELRQSIVDSKTDDRHYFYLIVADNGEKIGTVRIGPIDLVNKTSDLVCLIGNRKYAGRGLAKQAVAKASRIAFERYDIRRLHSGMFKANIASIKAYQGGGWFIEATLKGFYFVNGESMDRIAVACLSPIYFPEESWPTLADDTAST